MIFKKKYKNQSNAELLQQYIQNEDAWAFQTLYERYQKNLWNMYFAKTGNREDCRDLIQLTYEKLLISRGIRENNIQEFENYLMGIAFNLLKQYYHQKAKLKRVTTLLKEEQRQEAIPTVSFEKDPSQPQLDLLWAAIRQLSEKQQAAMEMHLSEMSYKEIATQMNTSETVVGSLLNRARQKLKKILREG